MKTCYTTICISSQITTDALSIEEQEILSDFPNVIQLIMVMIASLYCIITEEKPMGTLVWLP